MNEEAMKRFDKKTPIKLDGEYRYVVSTVEIPYLGYFETAVFEAAHNGKIGSYVDLDRDRYDTQEEAERGHEAMCAKWGGAAWMTN